MNLSKQRSKLRGLKFLVDVKTKIKIKTPNRLVVRIAPPQGADISATLI